jgi:hypothetical protein
MMPNQQRSQGGSSVMRATAGPSESDVRILIQEIAQATQAIVSALDNAGLDEQLRQSPEYILRTLDRSLPKQSLGELLLACEAFASVTGPSVLATGDLSLFYDEAQYLGDIVQTLGRCVSSRQRLTRVTGVMQGLRLRATLSEPAVLAGLTHLGDLFASVASTETHAARPRRRLLSLLPFGRRFIVPGTVLASALAFIIFLTGTIAFATGQVPVPAHGLVIPGLSHAATSTPQTHSTSGGTPVPATPTPKVGVPTATPGAHTPTPSPTPGKPLLSISQSLIQPCQGIDAQFSIVAGTGQSAVSWTATSPDPTNIQVSTNDQNFSAHVSGTLQPGQSVTVYVRVTNDTNTNNGTIGISANNGHSYGVQYDTSNC